MDRRALYEKAEKALNQAFETAKVSVKTMSEKAGEAAQITKLLIEKTALEHRMSKKFAELGSRAYDKLLREGKAVNFTDYEFEFLVEEIRQLDVALSQIEVALTEEQKAWSQGPKQSTGFKS